MFGNLSCVLLWLIKNSKSLLTTLFNPSVFTFLWAGNNDGNWFLIVYKYASMNLGEHWGFFFAKLTACIGKLYMYKTFVLKFLRRLSIFCWCGLYFCKDVSRILIGTNSSWNWLMIKMVSHIHFSLVSLMVHFRYFGLPLSLLSLWSVWLLPITCGLFRCFWEFN